MMKSKLTYQEFKEMEDMHSTGSLYKICQRCGDSYRPELRIYNKRTWKLKDTPIVKIQKDSKIKVDRFVKEKKVVGNWFLSKYCDKCSSYNEVKK